MAGAARLNSLLKKARLDESLKGRGFQPRRTRLKIRKALAAEGKNTAAQPAFSAASEGVPLQIRLQLFRIASHVRPSRQSFYVCTIPRCCRSKKERIISFSRFFRNFQAYLRVRVSKGGIAP